MDTVLTLPLGWVLQKRIAMRRKLEFDQLVNGAA